MLFSNPILCTVIRYLVAGPTQVRSSSVPPEGTVKSRQHGGMPSRRASPHPPIAALAGVGSESRNMAIVMLTKKERFIQDPTNASVYPREMVTVMPLPVGVERSSMILFSRRTLTKV